MNKIKKNTKLILFAVLMIFATVFAFSLFNAKEHKVSLDAKKLAAAKDVSAPTHSKTLTPNGDGTYKLELSVQGAIAPTEATANANILIVYDVSGSMSTNAYKASETGSWGYVNNNYVQLYRRNGNSYSSISDDDAYTGEVFYRTGNGQNRVYHAYNDTRYIRDARRVFAEEVLHELSDELLSYNKTDDADNVQMALVTFSNTTSTENNAHVVQSWTNSKSFSNYFGEGDEAKLSYSSGTNWEGALQTSLTDILSQADSDDTFVIFVTDGAPTETATNHTSANFNYENNYRAAIDEALKINTYDTTTHTYEGQDGFTSSNTTLYGIYAYGTDNDYLDDLMYYANNGEERANVSGDTVEPTTNFYRASDHAEVEAAIEEIMEGIVESLGVTDVSIADGTTHSAQLSSGEIVNLLDIADESTFTYWMSKEVYPYHISSEDWYIPGVDYDYWTTRIDRGDGSNIYVYFRDLGNNQLEVRYTRHSDGQTHDVVVTGTIESPATELGTDATVAKIQWKSDTEGGHSPELFFNQNPPPAHVVNGSVNWDLSEVGTLLNGVIYSVEFDVWKTQRVFDLIADLDNGKVAYEDLYEDSGTEYAGLRKYIDEYGCTEAGCKYRLITNTTATLAYKDTREDEEIHYDSYDTPQGIYIDSETIGIHKKWADYIGEKEETSIDVTLLKDGEEYLDITLSKNNNWYNTDPVYIAPGIMILDYDIDEETGKPIPSTESMEIKDPGHDYSFAEFSSSSETAYNWQMISETVHPMLLNGTLTELIKVDDNMINSFAYNDEPLEDYYIPTEMEADPDLMYMISNKGHHFVRLVAGGDVYLVADDTNPTIEAINYRRSNLNINKSVEGAPEDTDYTFNIQVNDTGSIKSEEVNEQTGEVEVTYDDLYFSVWDTKEEKYVDLGSRLVTTEWQKEIKDSNWTGYYYAANNTPLTVKLKSYENLRFINLTTKAEYSVTEDLSELDNFVFDGADVSAKYYTKEGEVVKDDEVDHDLEGYTVSGNIELTNSDYFVTMKNLYDFIDVPVEKVWDDEDDKDEIRPDSITVNLLADGEVEQENVVLNPTDNEDVTIDEDGNWHYTFTGLSRYKEVEEDGKISYEPITYSIEEVETGVITGEDTATTYDYEVTGDQTSGFVITNTHTSEVTEATVIKVWNDSNDNDGKRPDELVVKLKDGNNTVATRVLTEDNEWTATVDELQKYRNGEEIVYEWVEETVPDGYTLEDPDVDGTVTTLTNTHQPETVSSKVTKVWDDDDDRDGNRQEELTVTLSDGSSTVATRVLTEDNDWTTTVTGLPKYDNGDEITYTWSEGDLEEGYAMASSTNDPEDETNTIITNHYDPEKTRVCIKKVWDDDDDRDGKRPLSLTVTLSNGQFVTLNAENDWYAEIDDLFKYENHGSLINYTWSEEDVEGYELTGNTTEEELTTLTNTYNIETTSATVNKVWDDDDDNDGKRPETITVKLTADDPSFEDVTKTLSDDNEWTATVTGLPKYMNNGEDEVTYTWSEVSVPNGYTLEEPVVSGTTTTLTNKHVPEKTEVPVKKIWDETANTFGFDSPESVKVNLLANGTKVRDVVLSANNEWKYVFEDLPKYDNKEEITYLVEEEEVPDYDFSLEGNATDGFEITNTYNPTLIPVKVTKTWNDNFDQDGKRDGTITFILTGKVGESVVYTSPETPITGSINDEKWYYTFENLPEKYHGETITYSVTEKLPNGSVYTGENVSDVEIMNSYDPQTVSFNLTKIWDDDNDNDRVRPESITIHLLADGVELETAVITADDNWSWSISGLPKYRDHGVAIKYTITEDVVEGYKDPVISYTEGEEEINSTLTNPHENEKTSIEVQKVWVDDNDKYKIRPKTITVQIFANGKLVRTIEITAADNWRKVISDLDKYLQGEEITYTIIELPVDGYGTTIDGYTITNTILPIGKTEITPPNTKVGDTDTKSNLLLLIILLVTSVISAVTTTIKN